MNDEAKEASPIQTFGERAVGLSFNPSGDDAVAQCKREFAAVVDRMHRLRIAHAEDDTFFGAEVRRMASLAIDHTQTAQMWAVKAITWRG